MERIKLLYPYKNSQYQTFLQDFADVLVENGMQAINPVSLPTIFRLIAAKAKLSRNFKFISKDKYLFCLGAGYPDNAVFPFGYSNQIIPMLWDTWPKYWDALIDSFKRHNIKLAFFTQKRVAEFVHSKLPDVDCIHIAEGLEQKGYKRGAALKERRIDVLELGRLYEPIHEELVALSSESNISLLFAKDVTKKRLFDTFEELTDGLANTKIVINYPRCVTHPEMAGEVETLTQRYWECMYSRCVMVGHAPQELIDLIGYNPVLECTTENAKDIILQVLNRSEDYQELVDKNYESALTHASWKNRINLIKNKIEGYVHS